jgi:hypothetical protein
MNGGNEQIFAITFYFKAGLSATETPILVQESYGNEAVNRSNAFRCYSRFREGRELVQDDERGGRPKSTRTEIRIAAVDILVKNDLRIASRVIAESLNISKTSFDLKEDFCSRDIFLLHDDEPTHKAASVCQFLTKKIYKPLSPLVLSRLISTGLFSVPQFENELKRLHFADVAEIQEAVNDELKKV